MIEPGGAEKRSCIGKDKFKTRVAASRRLAEYGKRKKNHGQHAYRCTVCESWHTGHDPKRKGR